MKILVTGRGGQVGWELNRCLLPLGEVVAVDYPEFDLSKPEKLRTMVRKIRPDIIVNAAAYTAVDKAESEEELATLVNAAAPGVLAEEAERSGALLVHYSTDYVFDGTQEGPYTEDDEPNPINASGRTKLGGERAIQAAGVDHLILRTSWVYAARGNNFLRTILRLAREREELSIIDDQTGSPTWARLIADTTVHCLRQSQEERQRGVFKSDVYNLIASGKTTWFGFAQAILETARRNRLQDIIVKDIKPITTADYPTAAKRPSNSCLSTNKLEQNFNLTTPGWDVALKLSMETDF